MINFKLVDVLIPPEEPFNSGSSSEWSRIEKKLNQMLPHDYKWFIDTYGTGIINDLLIICNPFSVNSICNLDHGIKNLTESYLISHEYCPEDFSFDVYPENGGILPFGYSNTDFLLFWNTTNKNPNEWTIVVCDSITCYEFKMNFTDFLYNVLTQQIQLDFFSGEFINAGNYFVKYK